MRAASALGEFAATNTDAEFAKCGIRTRHLTTGTSRTLALGACISLGGYPDDLGLAIACSSTNDRLPPLSAGLHIETPGLQHFDLNAACASAVHALVIASDRMRSDDSLGHALIVGTDAWCNLHIAPDAAMLLSDGAGAVLLGREDRLRSAVFETDASNRNAVTIYENGFHMDGMAVWHQAMMHMPGLIRKAVERADWGMDDVDLFVLHQANGKMLDFLRLRLKIEPERWFTNVETTGNTGAASIPIALADACTQGRLHGKVVIAGLGAGFGFAASCWELP